MIFKSTRDNKASCNVNPTSSKPFTLLEELEPRILLSADGLNTITPDPLNSLTDSMPQVVQHAKLLETNKECEQATSDIHNSDLYQPILTLSADDESVETAGLSAGLDEAFGQEIAPGQTGIEDFLSRFDDMPEAAKDDPMSIALGQEVSALTSRAEAECSEHNAAVVVETTVDEFENNETAITTEDENLPVNNDENLSTEEAISIEIRGPPAIESLIAIIDNDGANLSASMASSELLETNNILTYEQLAPIVEEAINRWSASGFMTDRCSNLDQVAFTIIDFGDDVLGKAAGDTVYIDATAAGYGWFVDATPTDDKEYFELSSHQLVADSMSVAYGRIDLLTVVMHELGHVLGLEDLDPEDYSDELMSGVILPGERRVIGLPDDLASNLTIHDFAYLSGLNITTYTIDSLADVIAVDGVVTLREAIEAANTNVAVNEAPAGSDTEVDVIQFNPSLTWGTIILGGTELTITDDLDIQGLGAENLTIDADDSSRIFDLSAVTASISGLHITGGNDSQGGAIRNSGILTLSLVLVEGNQSADAGVIYNNGNLTIDESTVSYNTSSGSTGGAIVNDGVASVLVVTGSLLYNNSGVDGAGIRTADGDATIINSTISGNTATGPGGGIRIVSGTCDIVQSTVIGNYGSQGGGVYCDAGAVVLDNTVVVDNNAGSTGVDVQGVFDLSSDYNLIGVIDDSTGLDSANTSYGTGASPLDAMLGPLADNGGLTLTHMPWDGSPLLDTGDNNRALDYYGVPLTTDQRGTGFDRILNGTVEIGAVEGSRTVDFTLTGPLGTYFIGDLIPITWDYAGVPVDSTISLYYDSDTTVNGNEVWIIEDIVVPPSGQYDWDPPLVLPAGDYYIGGTVTTADLTDYMDRLVSPVTITSGGTSYIVDSNEDIVASGDGLLTLREAVEASVTNTVVGDAPAGSDTYVDLITFHSSLTGTEIVLVLGQFDITDDLVIRGLGANDLTINADDNYRIFNIVASVEVGISGLTLTDGNTTGQGGAIYNAGELELAGMTITDNVAEGDGGGGIYNVGTLVITDSLIRQNTATTASGAGIRSTGSLSLTNVTLLSNIANGDGGGIHSSGDLAADNLTLQQNFAFGAAGGLYVMNGGVFTMTNSLVTNNTGSTSAGGIRIAGATSAVVTDTTFENNTVSTGSGGGLYHSAAIDLTLTSVVFTGNAADGGSGGGLCVTAGSVTVTGGTFTGNSASSTGGAIYDNSSGTLVIQNSTISGNNAPSQGGGLWDRYGTTQILNTEVSGNSGGSQGGGIWQREVSMTISDSQVVDNSISGGDVYGGGIRAEYNGYLSISRTEISRNSAIGTSNAHGGGISMGNDVWLALTDSTVADNVVSGSTGGYGGGLFLRIYYDDVTITRSTISGNSVYGSPNSQGGGIYAYDFYNDRQLRVINSTISGNRAFGSASAGGGGIYTTGDGGAWTIVTNSTIALNEAAYGGGIYRDNTNARLWNTIVAGNMGEFDGPDVYGTFHTDSEYNLIGIIDGSTNLDEVNTQYGTWASPLSAGLGALTDNGGYTRTHALLDGSPALNAGSNSRAVDQGGAPLTTDQRGEPRILDTTVDMGPYEGSLTEIFALSGPLGTISAGNWEVFAWNASTIPANSTIEFFADPDGVINGNEVTLLAASDPNPMDGSWAWPVVNIASGTYTLGAVITDNVTAAQLESRLAGTTTIIYDLAYLVDSLGDGMIADGQLTLREAVEAANLNQVVGDAHAGRSDGIDIILFDASLNGLIILLTDGQLYITEDLSIQGPGDELLTVEREEYSPAARLFEVAADVCGWISGLRLYGGVTDYSGGAILNYGTLDIRDVTLTSNFSYSHGGAIHSAGPLTVSDSVIDGNMAGGASSNGGGIYCSGFTTICDTVISNNTATNNGGGLESTGVLTLTNCTVIDNVANNGAGVRLAYVAWLDNIGASGNVASNVGGIIYTSSGGLWVDVSTFTDNSAGSNGGAVYDSSGGTFVLRDTTISDNTAGSQGGGVWNQSTVLFIQNCMFLDNSAGSQGGGLWDRYGTTQILNTEVSGNSGGSQGGGIWQREVNMTINDSQVVDNSISGGDVYGGGIRAEAYGYLSISRTEISHNSAIGTSNAHGGGISMGNDVWLALTDSTVADNVVSGSTGGYGGGLFLRIYYDDVTITRSTVSGNSVYGASTSQGGAIYAYDFYNDRQLRVINSTISGNRAFGSASAGGGGIYTTGDGGAWTMVTNSTITLNEAAYGGGIYRDNTNARLWNTIVAGNTGEFDGADVYGTFHTDSEYNLIGIIDGSTNLDEVNTQYGTWASPLSAGLGALTDNGGYTRTHALLDGSPALNAGSNSRALDQGGSPLWTDQRGETRYLEGIVDVGSYEGSIAELLQLSGPTGMIYAGEPQLISWTNQSITATSLISLYGDPDGIINGNEIYLLEDGDPNDLGGLFTWYALELEAGVPYTLGATVVDQITAAALNDRLGATTTVSYSGAYIVDSLADTVLADGALTLREAVEAANTNAIVGDAHAGRDDAVDIIQFAPGLSGGTIALTAGQLQITDDLAIQGLGDDLLTVAGDATDLILNVYSDVLAWISGLTIRDGSSTGDGGGICNSGTLRLLDVTITSNMAYGYGGGLFSSGLLYMDNCVVSDNSTSGSSSADGGGIFVAAGSRAEIINTLIQTNTAGVSGGGIRSAGELTLSDSTVQDNASLSNGGGLMLSYWARLSNCTVEDNTASGVAGGIYIPSGAVSILAGSIISGNGAGSNGGGIYDASGGTLVIQDSTLSGNSAASQGGGLWDRYGTTQILNSVVSGNNAGSQGGGIWQREVSMKINDSQVVDNSVSGGTVHGGGIRAEAYGYLSISRSEISRNSVTGTSNAYGGAISMGDNVWLTLTDSTVADNVISGSSGGYGGGLFLRIYYDDVTITRSTISGNSVYGASAAQGGGIYAYDFYNNRQLRLINCAVSGNRAFGSASAGGGGIYTTGDDGAWTIVTNSTITLNEAAYGGGIYRNNTNARLWNAIVAGNTADFDGPDVYGTFHTDSEYNLIGIVDGSTNLDEVNSQYGTGASPLAAKLGSLSDNGGYTRTHALLDGSPALNNGGNSRAVDQNGDPLPTDQRGGTYLRIRDGVVDIGSYEGREDTYFALLAPAGGTVYAAWDTPIRWTGIVPTTSEISLYYDVDDILNGNEEYIITGASYPSLGGEYLWASVAVADGFYYIGASVSDPVGGGAWNDVTAQFELIHQGVPTLYVVDTTLDVVATDGLLSLREALEAANTNAAVHDAPAGDPVEMDVIQFASSLIGQTITLSAPLNITDPVSIQGVGEGDYRVTIDAAGTGVVFDVTGVVAEMSYMRLTGGVGTTGGAIRSVGTLTLLNMEIFNNTATDGGGVGNSGGTLRIEDTWIRDNTATGNGGAIFTEWGRVEVLSSTLSGNEALRGGGLYTGSFNDTIVSNSTISINTANGTGAGGGGLYNTAFSDSELINTTVTSNVVSGTSSSGGGLFIDSGSFLMVNTIVADNSAPTGPDAQGSFDGNSDYNVIGVIDGSTGLDGANSIYGSTGAPVNPLLDALADNGGPTPTHNVLTGSPAINGGDDTSAVDPSSDPLSYDQRGPGYDRILNGRVDMGAFEYNASPSDNPPPVISGLSLSVDPVTVGDAITLTAEGVNDDHGVVAVTFYRDVDRDGVGIPGEQLGVDVDGTDGWDWNGVVTWDTGQAHYLAQATDDGWPMGVKTSDFASVTGTVVAIEPPEIVVGEHYLLAGQAGQEVQIYVTGIDKVTGFNLKAQIGNGSAGPTEPVFESIVFSGGIWDVHPYTVTGGVIVGTPQLAQASVTFSNTSNEVLTEGLLVTLVIDTTGFSASESFDLKVTIDEIVPPDGDSEFVLYGGHEIYPTIVNGHIHLYESTVVDTYVFYNDSFFDSYDPGAGVADDGAIATDKSALLPEESAGFSNYTSYWRGINGIMVDISGLSNPAGLSENDFVFKVGNVDDTSTWTSSSEEPALVPTTITVRTGGGVGSSDRVTLIWDDNVIENEWLEVTVLATANTGLAQDYIFYFGNAIGEVGNSASDAFVDGVDFAQTRDHPRNFLNPAPIDYRYDHNRDRFVDGTDLAIVRDNPTNLLTALKLVTPSAPSGGGSMMVSISSNETSIPDEQSNPSYPVNHDKHTLKTRELKTKSAPIGKHKLKKFSSEVVGRYIFYNNSYFDGYDPAVNASDDNAIATDKSALLPGETATFSNYTSYWKGINGIIVDIDGIANPEAITADDFVFKVGNVDDTSTWLNAPDPISVIVRVGEGVGGSDRITIVWADNAIEKQWLGVTVLANSNTGLAENDVFYFGNAIGEVGNSTSDAFADGVDFAQTNDNPCNLLNQTLIDHPCDHNRDRFVDGTDLAIVRDNTTNLLTALKLISPLGYS